MTLGLSQGRVRFLNGACQVHLDSYHDSTCGECLLSLSLSLSLFTLCLSVEHAGSLKRGQL